MLTPLTDAAKAPEAATDWTSNPSSTPPRRIVIVRSVDRRRVDCINYSDRWKSNGTGRLLPARSAIESRGDSGTIAVTGP
jgi:hypothetical protein